MAVIKPKKAPVIQKGVNFTYHPPTFKEHKLPNFYDTDRAEDVLRLVQPFEFLGRRFLVVDTEDHPLDKKSHAFPYNVTRRWIGTGKKATPVDIPFCISFCDGKNSVTLYDSGDFNEFKKLRCWMEDLTIEKVFHNAKFDMHMWANIGLKIKGKIHDTVIIAKLVDENRPDFSLWGIAERRRWGIVKFEYMVDGYKKSHKIADYRHIPRQLLSEYANADVWNCYHLFVEEYMKLIADELIPLYENELVDMMGLWVMERIGMQVRDDYERDLKADLQRITAESEQVVYDTVGYVFNMNSNPQIHKALIHTGVDPSLLNFTDKGNPKLDKVEMERLEALGVDLVVKIQEYRKNEKLLNTYAVGIYDQRDENYRVHSSINQTEATTGRMSITKPALQTLPKKDKRIRKAFIPAKSYRLFFMDLDQVEYRGFAHYAQAAGLLEAIKRGHDVHQATAAIIFNKPYEDVTDDERSKAKTINFGLIYGQGVDLTAASLKMTKAEATRFRNHYFAMIPEAAPFINTVQRVIQARGYVKNFYGRRRRLKSDEAYKGPNALIQGWAADYIKHKLAIIFKFLMAHGYKSRMINIVHDELIVELHEDELHLAPKLRWLLSDFTTFRCPITAGADWGNPSWGEKVAPEADIGFDPLTYEEMEHTIAYDVFDGSIFDYCA